MPALLKIGILLLAVGTYFGGAYAYGERTGRAVQTGKNSDLPGARRDQDPAAFARAQRVTLNWCLGLLPLGGFCTVVGLVQRARQESA